LTNTEPHFRLSNGDAFPAIGYGTFGLGETEETVSAVLAALDAGYRLIDTASNYGNESAIGQGIRQSNVARSEIIVSSKVWPSDLGYDKTLEAFDLTMRRLDLDYLDLYLIHWPCSPELNAGSWKALEQLLSDRRVRYIGVSNFNAHHLQSLALTANHQPVVNQVELHPLFANESLRSFCAREGILVEAWSPLMQGKAFSDSALIEISRKHSKSVAQVVLRWCVQKGVVPIPKTKSPERMLNNISIFDFQLDEQDMAVIDQLDTGKCLVGPDPDSYRFCQQC